MKIPPFPPSPFSKPAQPPIYFGDARVFQFPEPGKRKPTGSTHASAQDAVVFTHPGSIQNRILQILRTNNVKALHTMLQEPVVQEWLSQDTDIPFKLVVLRGISAEWAAEEVPECIRLFNSPNIQEVINIAFPDLEEGGPDETILQAVVKHINRCENEKERAALINNLRALIAQGAKNILPYPVTFDLDVRALLIQATPPPGAELHTVKHPRQAPSEDA